MSTPKSGFSVSTLAWWLAVLLAMFILFALMVVPAMNKGTHPSMGHAYMPPAAPRAETEFAIYQGNKAPGIDLALAMKGDPAEMEWARAEYAKVCAACHGTTGKGDGPAGLALGARNFTQADGWKNGPRVDQIFRTLTHGLVPLMPAYDTYTQAQRLALANVVRGFQGFKAASPTAAELKAFDEEYSLSAGVQEASRIPVSSAMRLMAAEERNVFLNMNKLDAAWQALIENPQLAAVVVDKLKEREDAAAGIALGAPLNGFSTQVSRLDAENWKVFVAALRAALVAS
jgi:mono/diheme cytochrome c family protein